MKIRKVENGWEYWYDRSPGQNCWWAAKYDEEGNQIGDAVHAYTKDEIIEIAKD